MALDAGVFVALITAWSQMKKPERAEARQTRSEQAFPAQTPQANPGSLDRCIERVLVREQPVSEFTSVPECQEFSRSVPVRCSVLLPTPIFRVT